MPDLCRGSGSSLRPAYGTIITVSAASLEAALTKILPKETRVAFSAILAGATYNLLNLCSSPAPDFPTLTTEDWFNALSPVHTADYSLSVSRFSQWVLAYMWPTWCQCNDRAPPAAPVPIIPPPANQDTGLPDGSAQTPCWDVTVGTTLGGTATPPGFTDLTTTYLPTTQPLTVTPFVAGSPTTAQLIPAGATNLKFAFSAAAQAGVVAGTSISGEFFNASGAHVGFLNGVGCLNCSQPLTALTIPSGATAWTLYGENDGSVPYSATLQYQFFCSGTGPTQLEVPCCPPDPTLEIKLNQILSIVLNLTTGGGVVPPVSWHDGARHTALRGAGSFLISGAAIGMRFEVTTPPTGTKIDPGNPDFYWDMGFWSPYALGSPLRGGRLVFLNQSVELPEFSDQIGFTLRHGTVMNAIELLPTTT